MAERAGGSAFVFPGQGSKWIGTGQELLREEAVFAAVLERCDAAISANADWSLLEIMAAKDNDPRLQQIDVIQPALISLMVSVAALLSAISPVRWPMALAARCMLCPSIHSAASTRKATTSR